MTDWNVLSGTLPPSIGNLTELRILNLRGNSFYGPIPETWKELKEMESINLGT